MYKQKIVLKGKKRFCSMEGTQFQKKESDELGVKKKTVIYVDGAWTRLTYIVS
jgi:hypothetical protein